jgi:hypothetical protein
MVYTTYSRHRGNGTIALKDSFDIRHLYNKHLSGHDGFDEMIVAFSRPKNLRELLTNTVLNERPGGRMSDIITSSRHATPSKP